MGLAGEADAAEAVYWYHLALAQGHAKAETQAQLLRNAGIAARMPPGAPAVAAREPSSPPKPVAKPVVPESEPETVVISAPEPEPVMAAALQPPPQPQPQAAVTPPTAAGGAYSAWLITFKGAAESRN